MKQDRPNNSLPLHFHKSITDTLNTIYRKEGSLCKGTTQKTFGNMSEGNMVGFMMSTPCFKTSSPFLLVLCFFPQWRDQVLRESTVFHLDLNLSFFFLTALESV